MSYLNDLFQALDIGSLTDAATRLVGVFLCLTIHETCHGLAAYALGDPTAKSMHRLSLNPLRHIDWIGLCMMFFCGFGWAKPVPVDPRYFRKPKQGMALTALAGPVSNLLLALLLLLVAASSTISPPIPTSGTLSSASCWIPPSSPSAWASSTWSLSRRWMGPRSWRPSCRTGPISS